MKRRLGAQFVEPVRHAPCAAHEGKLRSPAFMAIAHERLDSSEKVFGPDALTSRRRLLVTLS